MTFVATANAVLYAGATPVFADIRPDDLLISPDAVAAAVTPATRAIIAVDYAGHPADYPALRAIADRAPAGPLTIIADASHSLGATLAGQAVGTLADLTVLSPAPGQDHDDGRGRRRPDRSRRPGGRGSDASATTGSRASSPTGVTGRTRWSSSATTIG